MKIEKRRYEKLFGKNVAVGVPHFTERRPFYHYGQIVEVDDNSIVLETKKGLQRIVISDIIQLSILELRDGDY